MGHKILNVENLVLVLVILGVVNGNGEERLKARFPPPPFFLPESLWTFCCCPVHKVVWLV